MEKLSAPDKGLISRLLEEVCFDKRIVGYRVNPRSGPVTISMYSFEEVVRFLDDRFPLLKFDELTDWLRTVIEDEELTVRITEAVKEENNDHDRTQRIKVLMGERLHQCKKNKHAK